MEEGNKEIWITEFTLEKAIEYRKEILEKAVDPNSGIIIYISSYGGEAAALLMLLDTLDSIRNPIITVASGVAMSCGAYLLMRGDHRYMGKNTHLMFHRASAGGFGTDIDMKIDAEYTKRLSESVIQLVTSKLSTSKKKAFKKMMESNKDVYFNQQEALQMGIITDTGVPRLIETAVVGLVK